MGSESWTTFVVLQTPRLMPYLGGTLTMAIRRGNIPGLKDFLLQIHPDLNYNNSHGNSIVNQFWEHTFHCRFAPPPAGWVEAGGALCTGQEDLKSVETEFFDISDLRPEYNVHKAVYALAYALDDMLQCEPGRGPFSGNSCASFQSLEPWQPPRSVCSESCPPGTRMARKKGQPECCFDCIPCSEGKISNKTDSMECTSCPEDFWSSPQRDHCVPKTTEFLSYHDPLGIFLTATSLLGTVVCAIVLGIFIYHRSTPIGQFHLNGMHKAGDVILGGLFDIHFFSTHPDLSFTSEPRQPTCHGFDVVGCRLALTMAFTIDEINRNSNLIPNVTLGYSLYDNCNKLGVAFRSGLSLLSGQEEQVILHETCIGTPPVLGIVGDSSSTRSIAISTVLGLYRVPLVSYFATCSCLSDRQRFPSFFRTIPSDAFQVRAMIQILKHFGWTWAGLLICDDDYGLNAARSFQSDLGPSGGGCLAYTEILPWGNDPSELKRIVDVMKKSTARVVIVLAYESHMINLMEEVARQNLTGLQWMASEGWTSAATLQTPRLMPYLGGTLGIAIRRGEIPGLKDFLLQIRPDLHHNNSYGNNMVNQFWEYIFQCRFAPPPAGWVEAGGALCTGQEDIENVVTEFLDILNLRAEYNVYKAVYALAYALDDMLRCEPGRGPFSGHSCGNLQRLEPWQFVYYLEKVNFTTSSGDQVSFDENGDVLPIYDIMNWQWLPDGRTKLQTVGEVKKSAFKGEELTLDEDKIFWNFESKQPPRSVCSESCPPGTRIARKKGEPKCCFDCIPCSEGKISNKTDSMECSSCPEDFWSSPQRDHCVPKTTEFLSYHEPLGIFLTATSLVGTFVCAIVVGIYIYHRSTPIVRANNSELSFQLLLSLKLCFLCSLLFIGRPTVWTCQLRHAAFGISFVLCVSCILVKTMVVLAVFKASKPGGETTLKWFGVLQQRGTVLVLTSIQATICTAWLLSSSPTPHKNLQYHIDKIIYECVVGSTVGFAVLLGYIGLLAILSFLLAFLARNLPDNFNEAKLITFSMLIFCTVWVAFVPAYISSPGKYADAVEVFAILASSFGLLVALFGPKCYIILLRPERNTKKAIMGRGIKS
ncbi:extracellular calcium-sensing receptor-like [Lates calcarifer]|uniref:Extracellular calcium-sensing receptor-like n=1 Tax=Lates calcarifer TaxID=8187 RepID=A0AAJ8AVV1_LATCA|nr:extracellular calcium-sensing receptor-like [Lates calcarifer]